MRPALRLLAAASAASLACGGDSSGPNGLVTDDPRTASCQRGALQHNVTRTSALGRGDCRSASADVYAEVWTLSVPPGDVATVNLTSVFDGVLLLYDPNATLLGTADLGGPGDPESLSIDQPGDYLLAVAAYDPTGAGPYSVIAGLESGGLNGFYMGVASGTYAGVQGSGDISFLIASTGTTLSGTWLIGTGTFGTLTGTLSGTSFSFTLTEDLQCPGTFTGSGTIENAGNHLTGSLTGSDCGGSASLTFSADRT